MASVNDPGDRKRIRTGTRTAGLRRAREAKQLRDARRRERERALEAALVEYYTWLAVVDETRDKARKRAGRILAEAEDEVQMPLAQAGNALRRLRDLGETREAIRELTQISTSRLREILAHAPRSTGGGEHAETDEGEASERTTPRSRYEDETTLSRATESTSGELDVGEADYVPQQDQG